MKFTLLPILLALSSSHIALAVYDAFPEAEGPFALTANSVDNNWVGEDFGSYNRNEIIECSNGMQAQAHLDVTSGCLWASNGLGNSAKGWTNDDVFRMVTVSHDSDGRLIKWTNQTIDYVAYIKHNKWSKDNPVMAYSGLHVFFRYQDNDNLYVASARYDGKMTIKQKVAGVYSTLALGDLPQSYLNKRTGNFFTGQWISLKASAIGSNLKFFVDGVEMLSTVSETLDAGTTGIRTDSAEIYFDKIEMGDF